MLKPEFTGQFKCHIEPDWLLVYQIINDNLILKLIRTGSHSDLF
jgi:mRNA interferase YafQ